MEEMSKKTKRLEKENMNLTRKHDLHSKNILEMAEQREQTSKELDSLRKKNEKLTSIINQMQKQGRGVVAGMAAQMEGGGVSEGEYVEGELEGTESDYEYEDEDGDGEEGDEVSDEGDYNEDTEEELHLEAEAPRPFGPPLPPALLPMANGVAPAVNGIKH